MRGKAEKWEKKLGNEEKRWEMKGKTEKRARKLKNARKKTSKRKEAEEKFVEIKSFRYISISLWQKSVDNWYYK